jgi:hypothetical protein
MFRTALILAALTLTVSTAPCFAADRADVVDRADGVGVRVASLSDASAESALGADVDWSLPPVQFGHADSRPAMLPALYASLIALQAYDGYSTSRGLSLGAHEANPMMTSAVGNTGAKWAAKVAAAAVPMVLAERLWHRNRAAAVVVMILANGVSAAVAANNARVIHQIQ